MAATTSALKAPEVPDHGHPPSPGQVVQSFLDALDVSPDDAARALGIPRRHVHEIVRDECRMTVDHAYRLAGYFGTSAQFWLTLQRAWDLWRERRPVDAPPVDERVAIVDAREAARYERGLGRLRTQERLAVVGRIEEGRRYDALATDLDLPTAEAARSAVSLALLRLAGIMADLEQEDATSIGRAMRRVSASRHEPLGRHVQATRASTVA